MSTEKIPLLSVCCCFGGGSRASTSQPANQPDQANDKHPEKRKK